MGANDKVYATFHGGEYTPSERYPGTARVRERYLRYPDSDTRTVRGLLFDRWLDDIRAEAKAEALNEAYNYGLGRTGHVLHRWLRDRVNQYKEAQVSVSDSVRSGQKYRLKPVMLAKTEQIDRPVTVTRVFRDSGGVEMVKFEPGTYAGNPHGYESLKYFKAKFDLVTEEEQ